MNKNTLIRDIKKEVSTIKSEIATFRLMIEDQTNIPGINIAKIQTQISTLEQQKLIFKAQLERVKTEVKKASLEENEKTIKDRLLMNEKRVSENNEKISRLESELCDLESQLKTLELLKKEGYQEGVNSNTLQETIHAKQLELEMARNADQSAWISIEKNSAEQNEIKTQIFNLEVITNFKNALTECKLQLKKLHSNLPGQIIDAQVIQKQEEIIKSEMKNIIKDIIHAESFFKIQKELRNTRNELANLEYLKNEKVEISEKEISDTKNRIRDLEKQINAETHKAQLQKELKDEQEKLASLKSCLGISGIEDVANCIKETEVKISKLDSEIAKITTASLRITKTISDKETATLSGKETVTVSEEGIIAGKDTDTSKIGVLSGSSAALIIQEIQKWLAENIINEGLGADIPKVLVSAVILNTLKKKVNSPKKDQKGDNDTQNQLVEIASGACQKFCMTKALEYFVSKNPVFSIAYGLAIIAHHCILGDAELSTLTNMVKTFIISESIKYTGAAILGALVTGSLGTAIAIPAGLYIATDVVSQWNTKADSKKPALKLEEQLPIQDLLPAAIDMLADFTVEIMWKKVCSQ